MMNFDALTRCFEHEIFEHGCHHEFFWTRITRMTRIFLFGTRISPISRIFVRGGALTWGTRDFWTQMSPWFFLNTNNADNTNIICTRRRGAQFWLLNVELLRLAAMWNWPMMNFEALTRCFEHEIRRRPTDRREVIKRMTRIFFCTRRRGAQCWVLNVECWIVAAGRNVELTNDEFRSSHEMFWTRDSP